MPVIITDDEKPTYVAKPDMRFATTFLSYKYRDYAVIGESLQDKSTGEIYTKREDGRTVSFFQNKKIYENVCLDTRVMLDNNPSFKWPSESDKAYYSVVNYDSLTMFTEKRLDILTTDVVFPNNDSNTSTQFKFNLSTKTNGFFICATSRDPDKPGIDYLSAKYNEYFKDYSGTNPQYMLEHEKFGTITKWEWSNAVIHYTVTVKSNEQTKVYTCEDYFRINEISLIYIPEERMHIDFPEDYTSVLVTIKGIQYYKLHFMIDHFNEFDENFRENYNRLVYPDHEMYIDWYEILSFLDSADDLVFLGNEFVLALLDVPYLKKYFVKMGQLLNSGGLILSKNKPDDGVWIPNVAWGERLSDVYAGGIVMDHNTTTDIRKMEAMLAGVNYIQSDLTFDINRLDDFCLVESNVAVGYSEDSVRSMVNKVVDNSNNEVDNLVIRASDNNSLGIAKAKVARNGLIMGTVFTTESDESDGE